MRTATALFLLLGSLSYSSGTSTFFACETMPTRARTFAKCVCGGMGYVLWGSVSVSFQHASPRAIMSPISTRHTLLYLLAHIHASPPFHKSTLPFTAFVAPSAPTTRARHTVSMVRVIMANVTGAQLADPISLSNFPTQCRRSRRFTPARSSTPAGTPPWRWTSPPIGVSLRHLCLPVLPRAPMRYVCVLTFQ